MLILRLVIRGQILVLSQEHPLSTSFQPYLHRLIAVGLTCLPTQSGTNLDCLIPFHLTRTRGGLDLPLI